MNNCVHYMLMTPWPVVERQNPNRSLVRELRRVYAVWYGGLRGRYHTSVTHPKCCAAPSKASGRRARNIAAWRHGWKVRRVRSLRAYGRMRSIIWNCFSVRCMIWNPDGKNILDRTFALWYS